MFVDAGLPRFFKELYAAGAEKEQLRVKVAGGGKMGVEETDVFAIGRRNYDMLHKLLLEDGIRITGEDIGGKISRTLYLDIGTGRTWLMSNGKVWDL